MSDEVRRTSVFAFWQEKLANKSKRLKDADKMAVYYIRHSACH